VIRSNTSSLLANSAKAAMLLVSHSPQVQDTAWDFAWQLDLTHKLWSDMVDLRRGRTGLDTDQTALNAIYRDKYQTGEHDLELKTQRLNSTAASDSSTSSLSNFLPASIISSIYSKFSSNSNKTGDRTTTSEKNELVESVLRDCRLLFDEHYSLATRSLDQLVNEYSEKEAISSLRSILNVMRDTTV
jgi:hypothetical protein